MDRQKIFKEIVRILADSFELEADDIKPESTLYEELGLDSIDAVDIFVQLRELTGRRANPDEAREVRTVDELISFVERELERAAKGEPEPDVPLPTGGR